MLERARAFNRDFETARDNAAQQRHLHSTGYCTPTFVIQDVSEHANDDVESSDDDEGSRAKSHRIVAPLLTTAQFMQRSAAKSTASLPSTPNGPPSKKARLSNGTSAPGTPGSQDYQILQTALAEEERKQQEALDKAARYTGETKWVLSFQDPLEGKRQGAMQVRQAGFAEIDAEDDSEDEEEETRPARMQFGGGLKKKPTVRISQAQNYRMR